MSKHRNIHDTVLLKTCLAHVRCRADFYQPIKVQEWIGPHSWTLIWLIKIVCRSATHKDTKHTTQHQKVSQKESGHQEERAA